MRLTSWATYGRSLYRMIAKIAVLLCAALFLKVGCDVIHVTDHDAECQYLDCGTALYLRRLHQIYSVKCIRRYTDILLRLFHILSNGTGSVYVCGRKSTE